MKYIISTFFIIGTINCKAQSDTSKKVVIPLNTVSPIVFSGYLETYYCYDFNKPLNNNRPSFFYSHNRHNEFNINLAYLKAAYTNDKLHANITLASGTYMNSNYISEPATLKMIYEANVGIKLGKRNLWLDAGIFSSHIGFESAISKDSWTLTRSILAENSPYYESGVKLSYTSENKKWFLSGLALNGWQRITRVNGNSLISFGNQIQFKPNETTIINYSGFIGTDKPDSQRLMRYYNNFYLIFNLNKKLGITAGFDIGFEQKEKKSSSYNNWYSPVIIMKYAVNSKTSISGRIEYYKDKNGVIISNDSPAGFNSMGYSLNIDYAPIENAVLRLEFRKLKSKDPLYLKENQRTNVDNFITTSIALSF